MVERQRKKNTAETKKKYRKRANVKSGLKKSLLGLFIGETKKLKVLTREEERELAKKAKQGDEAARRKLIEHLIRYSPSIAWKLRARRVEYLDLIQEINIGIILAADRFDETLGFRLGTYAESYIKRSADMAALSNGMIRVPVSFYEKCRSVIVSTKRLSHKLGRRPDSDEIAADISFSIQEVEYCFYKMKAGNLTYLDDSVDSRHPHDRWNDEMFHDVTRDRGALTPEQVLELKEELAEAVGNIRKLLAKLFRLKYVKDRDKNIFRIRYGLNGSPKTLEEIGKEFRMTRERVRQVVVNAWRKIKNVKINGEKDYCEEWIEKEMQRVLDLAVIAGLPEDNVIAAINSGF